MLELLECVPRLLDWTCVSKIANIQCNLLHRMIALGLFSRVHRIYKEKEKKGKDKDKKDEKKKSKDEKPKTETNDVEMSPKSEKKDKVRTF